MIEKLRHVVSTAGVTAIPWRLYSYAYKFYLRSLMPNRSPIVLNGVVTCHNRKFGDAHLAHLYMPLDVEDNELYESGLGTALRAEVRAGDKVVVVGGGSGVTVVIAAQRCSPTGSVICFEGDPQGVRNVVATARLNGVSGTVSVVPAIVGENIRVYGNATKAGVMSATDLPDCDVLELDCEGAEILILRTMRIRPRTIILETHGFLGASTAEAKRLLNDRGYAVEECGVAEGRDPDDCLRKDLMILIGTRRDALTAH